MDEIIYVMEYPYIATHFDKQHPILIKNKLLIAITTDETNWYNCTERTERIHIVWVDESTIQNVIKSNGCINRGLLTDLKREAEFIMCQNIFGHTTCSRGQVNYVRDIQVSIVEENDVLRIKITYKVKTHDFDADEFNNGWINLSGTSFGGDSSIFTRKTDWETQESEEFRIRKIDLEK